MKKLLFLAVLLGLTGCGETDQNDTSQTTLQSSPASFNYYKAASARTMSAPVASFGQWVVNGYTSEGASTVLNANRTIGGVATESKALITPNVSQVSKILRAGLGGFALKFAVDELLDGIDWVMDPANNQIRYKKYIPSSGSYFRVEAGFSAANCSGNDLSFFSTIEEATSRTTSCFQAIGLGTPVCNFITPKLYKCSSGKGLPVEIRFYGTQTEVEETLPLDVVSQKIIDNAQSDNADAQAVTLAAAQAIVSEAENDAEKAEPIVRELDDNSTNKCPSGITNNGSCWVCSRESWAPIRGRVVYAKDVVFGLSKCSAAMNSSQLLTRYKAFTELGAARDAENSCWAPQDQNHLQEAVEAKQTAAECNTYLGILGQ